MTQGMVIDGCLIVDYDAATQIALIWAKDNYFSRRLHYRVGRIEVYPDGRPAYMSDAPGASYYPDFLSAVVGFQASTKRRVKILAAACPRCGGWTSSGGMSHVTTHRCGC